jgi:hypothetical protein
VRAAVVSDKPAAVNDAPLHLTEPIAEYLGVEQTALTPVCTENLSWGVVVMKSAQDGT